MWGLLIHLYLSNHLFDAKHLLFHVLYLFLPCYLISINTSTRTSFVLSFVIGKNVARYAGVSNAVSPCNAISLIVCDDVCCVLKLAVTATVLSSIFVT